MRPNPLSRGPRAATALIALCALCAACSKNSSPTALASATIDSTGGTVAVGSGTYAGTAVAIPATALTDPTAVSIWADTASSNSMRRTVSSAARFEPLDIALNSASTLTLVITGSLPAGTVAADLVVGLRDKNGVNSEVPPTSVDLTAGTITLDRTEFGVFWVDLKTDDFIPATSYMAFNNGQRFEYSNNINMTMELSSTQPNFGGSSVWVMGFQMGITPEPFGFYMRNELTIPLEGYFNTVAQIGQQAIPDVSLVFLPNLAKIGATTMSQSLFSGYQPFGSTNPQVRSQWTSGVTVVSQGPLTTPAGVFNDVIEVEYMNSFGSTIRTDRIWFARNVGPVQIALDGTPIGALVSRT